MKYELAKLQETATHAIYSDHAGSGCIMYRVKIGAAATRWICAVPGVGTWRAMQEHVQLLACEGAQFITVDYPNTGNRILWQAVQTASGNRWVPVNGIAALASVPAASSNVTTTTEAILMQVQLPTALGVLNLLQNLDRLLISATLSKSAGTETLTTRLRVGTAGTTADTAVFTSTSQLAGSARAANVSYELKRMSATSILALTSPSPTTAFGAAVTVANLDTSAQIYVSLTGQFATNATSETARLEDGRASLHSHIG